MQDAKDFDTFYRSLQRKEIVKEEEEKKDNYKVTYVNGKRVEKFDFSSIGKGKRRKTEQTNNYKSLKDSPKNKEATES